MALEHQEKAPEKELDHSPTSHEDCDGPNVCQTELVTANEGETPETHVIAEEMQPTDVLQSQKADLNGETPPDQEENFPQAESAEPDLPIKKVEKGGILIKPLHALIGSFFIVALLVGAVLFGMWLVGRDNGPAIEENVKDYDDIYATAADLAAGNFAAPGYSEITLPAGQRDVQIILPNPKGNPCYFRYTLVLKDTGEVLYTSGLIEPGKAITAIRLARPLEVGDYVLDIQIEATALENQEAMNGINMEIKLKVR